MVFSRFRRGIIKRFIYMLPAATVLMVFLLLFAGSCSTDIRKQVSKTNPGRFFYPEGDIGTLSLSEKGAVEVYPVLPLDEAFLKSGYDEFIMDFLGRKSGSGEIAGIIIEETRRNSLPISLTFSLAWAESRFNPFAVNMNTGSVDRGLFQLNDRSFPDLEEAQFFDPVMNARNGVAYLKYCLERGENEVTALAMYNAGPTRVSQRGAPKMTLDYIHKIMTYRDSLEEDFQSELRSLLVQPRIAKNGEKLSYIVDREGTYQ